MLVVLAWIHTVVDCLSVCLSRVCRGLSAAMLLLSMHWDPVNHSLPTEAELAWYSNEVGGLKQRLGRTVEQATRLEHDLADGSGTKTNGGTANTAATTAGTGTVRSPVLHKSRACVVAITDLVFVCFALDWH